MNIPKLTCFGSCRTLVISKYVPQTRLNELITFTHSTKEVIQLIKFLKKEINIPNEINKYCFRTGIIENRNIELLPNFITLFDNTDTVIIEICSSRIYNYEGYYLHHLAIDTRFPESNNTPENIKNIVIKTIQSKEELELDLVTLREILHPKQILIISHFNTKHNGIVFQKREILINNLQELCNKHNIPFYNPTILFNKFKQFDII